MGRTDSSARVVGSKRLTGGLTSMVHQLTVRRNGRREEYVLRWWMADSEWAHWIARAVPLETAILSKLEGSDIPVPRVIGSLAITGRSGGNHRFLLAYCNSTRPGTTSGC
jgi:hypothetical protein